MLTQGKFLVSYQVFNIPVKHIGQMPVLEVIRNTQPFTLTYRTEQIRPYLRYPGEDLRPEHLHTVQAIKNVRDYWNIISEKILITDIIPIPDD